MNYDLKTRLEFLFKKCVDVRKFRVDCFFKYSPHVDWVSVQVYKDGWKPNSNKNIEFIIQTKPREYEDDISQWLTDQIRIIDECEQYIKDCCQVNIHNK